MAKSYTVYAIDLLGFGASDKPAGFSYSMEAWAQVCMFLSRKSDLSLYISHLLLDHGYFFSNLRHTDTADIGFPE